MQAKSDFEKLGLKKSELAKLGLKLGLKGLCEKSDRSIQSESSKARSTRRLTSSDDTAGTACSSSLSSQSTMDDESFHSQLLDVSSASTSFHTAKPQDDVFFDSAVNEVAVLPSSVSMDEVLSRKGKSLENEKERQDILRSREVFFYERFTCELNCMFLSCQILSTGMVPSGNGNKNPARAVLDIGARTLQVDSFQELVQRTSIGSLIDKLVDFVKKNIAVVPFIDVVGSVVQGVATLYDEKIRKIGMQRVADFANAFALENNLGAYVDHLARIIVRTRRSMKTNHQFAGAGNEEFCRIKRSMLHVVGETSSDTPMKEQACKAAECVLSHIMMPTLRRAGMAGPSDAEIVRGWVAMPERLVAATLNVRVEEIRRLPRFSGPAPVQP
jgi:hypothetical protein